MTYEGWAEANQVVNLFWIYFANSSNEASDPVLVKRRKIPWYDAEKGRAAKTITPCTVS